MTYLSNLSDQSKESRYLITINPTFIYDDSDKTTEDTNVYSVPFDYGEVEFFGYNALSVILKNTRESVVNDFGSGGVPSSLKFTEASSSAVGLSEYYHDKVNKKIFFGVASTSATSHPIVSFKHFISSDITRAYTDPTDDTSELRQWDPILTEDPVITRDISDFTLGVYPSYVSSISVSTTDVLRRAVYHSIFYGGPIEIFHVVGDVLDTTNIRRVYKGSMQSAANNRVTIQIDFNDGSKQFDAITEHPDSEQDFSTLGAGYNVDNLDKNKKRRKIYGVVNGMQALNVDRPADPDAPTTSENRKWIFALYDGDNDKIKNYSITNDSDFDIDFNTSTDQIVIETKFLDTSSDADILTAANNFEICKGDFIKFTADGYPAETFYVEVSDVDPGGVETSGANRSFVFNLDSDVISVVSTQTGDSEAVSRSTLGSSTVFTVERSVTSRLYLRDNDSNFHRLDLDTHYSLLRDSTEKIYGIQLINNVEAIISGLGYTPLTGEEDIFGRCYGPKFDDSTFGHNTFGSQAEANDFSHSGNNSTMSSVLYDYFKKYLRLDDSEIDKDTFDDRAISEKGFIGVDSGDKKLVHGSGNKSNFVFPRQISGDFESAKDTLRNFILPNTLQVYINNEGKWTFRDIFDVSRAAQFTLDDTEYEFLGPEQFTSLDLFGDVVAEDSFLERVRSNEISSTSAISYSSSSSARIYSNNKRSAQFSAWQHYSIAKEDGNLSFTGVTLADWGEKLARLYQLRQNFFSIRVSRDYFNIDLGNIVELTDSQLSGGVTGTPSRKYVVVGIRQSLDFRVIKLSDINNIIELNGDSVYDSSIYNASNSTFATDLDISV